MDALPYYKWHWQDYRANRRVQRMPWQARGPYRELLDEFWAEGSLPVDHAELADICAMSLAEFEQWWPHMEQCWEVRGERMYNRKMDEQRTATDKARVAMAVGGKAGGTVSNSSTRAKGTLEVPQAMPDIEEERRLEETRGDLKPLASTADAVPADRGKLIGTVPVLKPPGDYALHEADATEWQETFPGVDVRQELRKCKQWCVDNPKLRKTRSGIRRFINSWLSRAQNEAGNGQIRNGQFKTRSERNFEALHNSLRSDSEVADSLGGGAAGDDYGALVEDIFARTERLPRGRLEGGDRPVVIDGARSGTSLIPKPS